jgi:hypothetical protein
LIGPYSRKPADWLSADWYDLHGSGAWRITTTGITDSTQRVIRVKTIQDVLAEYRHHAEPKSLDPDGSMCSSASAGLLQRRPVTTSTPEITYIGKESNRLEDTENGLIHDQDEILTTYQPSLASALPPDLAGAIRTLGTRRVATTAGVTERTIRNAIAGTHTPKPRTIVRLRAAVHALRNV